MRIETYLNTTEKEVQNKTFNVWVGVSLGNKYFTKPSIATYIGWALQFTRKNVLVVIADDIQAINFEVFDGKSKDVALKKARKIADKKYQEIEEIIHSLPKKEQTKIRMVRWADVTNYEQHTLRERVIFNAFSKNTSFHDYIIDIIKEARPDRVNELSVEKLDKAAEYVLREIPLFINGVEYQNKQGDWETYELNIYPGLSKSDELFIGLQNGTLFPEIAKQLKITNKIAILEAYVD